MTPLLAFSHGFQKELRLNSSKTVSLLLVIRSRTFVENYKGGKYLFMHLRRGRQLSYMIKVHVDTVPQELGMVGGYSLQGSSSGWYTISGYIGNNETRYSTTAPTCTFMIKCLNF